MGGENEAKQVGHWNVGGGRLNGDGDDVVLTAGDSDVNKEDEKLNRSDTSNLSKQLSLNCLTQYSYTNPIDCNST